MRISNALSVSHIGTILVILRLNNDSEWKGNVYAKFEMAIGLRKSHEELTKVQNRRIETLEQKIK